MKPGATYRIQFHLDFPFAAALPLIPYLQRLGVTHLYASPIFKSRPGSLHGYDITDPGLINPELGGEDGFRRLATEAKDGDLGLILDIVPNHMAAHADNRWWMDVLAQGRESPFAHYFDIDWDTTGGKVLLPVLGKPYWKTLDAGEIEIRRPKDGASCVTYFDKRFPLRPEDQDIAPDDVRTADALNAVLERQHYRLAWWRTANDTINWRRFFDVSDLIAVKQESEEVFEATHAKVLEFYREGLIDGVRVDHVDGLADPQAYCRRLRTRLDDIAGQRSAALPAYIVVEKILGEGESLPESWGVDGTTGYDFMNEVSALQHCGRCADLLGELWRKISGQSVDFELEEVRARGELVRSSFVSALDRTAAAFHALAVSSKVGRDIALPALRRALVQVLQQLRIYRTYVTGGDGDSAAGAPFQRGVTAAIRVANSMDRAAVEFIAQVMNGQLASAKDAIRRFNQLSAPVAAKAVEDTAFYRYGRLLSRNDVGFNPSEFAIPSADFHSAMQQRQKTFPAAMLATATHDHKRGEDTRARLAVLSEIPEEWEATVHGWFADNAQHRLGLLDPADEYHLYQTMVGAWPLTSPDAAQLARFRERIVAWQQKALREAKLHTSWLDPNETYEEAAQSFVDAIFDAARSGKFLDSLQSFVERIAPAGALNGLVQAALRCTVPGVPDCYQGSELWDFSFVDPDNRCAVDYRARIDALNGLQDVGTLLRSWRDGRVKQATIAALLNLRKQRLHVFTRGEYIPVQVDGVRATNVLAFAKCDGGDAIVVAVPLHCARTCEYTPLPEASFWGDTQVVLPQYLRERKWRSLFHGEWTNNFGCESLFARFPVAVLLV